MTGTRFKPYPETKDSGIEWLGQIPAHWMMTRLRFAVESILNGTTATQLSSGESACAVTRIETISDGVINLEKVGYVKCAGEIKRYRLRNGDVLLSHINSLPMIGNCALYDISTPLYSGMNLLRLRPKRIRSGVWLWNWLRTSLLRQAIRARAKPSINQASIPIHSIKDLPFCSPPDTEQQAIADFLDCETEKIDALVEKKERLIKLLQEKRAALITHAVTRGLNPDAPMRDSGIEWLGQIPAHWDTGRVGMFSQQVTDGAHISPDTTFPDYPFVSTVDIVGGRIDFENCLGTTSDTYAYMERTGCRPRRGDVLFSKDGTVGRTTVVDTDAEFVVASSLVIISPRKEAVVPWHLEYWLNGAFIQELVELHLSGAALRRISVAKVGNLPIALPPLDEQHTITDFLDRETAKIDALISKVQEAIERLKEYRTALISAAVTGKIDVRNE